MSKPRARLTSAAAAATAILLLLSACGSDDGDSSSGKKKDTSKSAPTTLAEPKQKDLDTLESIDVTPPKGDTGPKVSVKDPVTVSQTTLDVLKKGSGEKLGIGDFAKVDVAMFKGNGKPLKRSSTYGEGATYLPLTKQPQGLAGLIKVMNGRPIGTRGVAVLPPEDVFGPKGNKQFGINGKDNLIVVFDVRGMLPKAADGKDVAPKKGMPQVKWSEKKPAEITIPKDAKKPKKLQVEHLKKGDGPTVEKGDMAYVHYTGVTWDDGKVFDSSKKSGRGSPFTFPVGQGSVIPAWDEGVQGAKVGDRLLIVAPPDEAYGDKAQGPIKANSTLVFVVDVLGKA